MDDHGTMKDETGKGGKPCMENGGMNKQIEQGAEVDAICMARVTHQTWV